MIENVMRKLYSDWDDLPEEKKKQFLKETEEELRENYPQWDALNNKQKEQLYFKHYSSGLGNQSIAKENAQAATYNNLRPRWNPCILFTILLGPIGIIIIIFYTVYKNQKINEFNQWFYEKHR